MSFSDGWRGDARDSTSIIDRRIDQLLALIAEHSLDPVISEKAQELRVTPEPREDWSQKALQAFHDMAVFLSMKGASGADDPVGR
ncbi:hypothetical protein [[Mycobacterium] wendilense]|uniref:Uncharacterized protein n=1 Tax=[Mycobacterium] wendilense TaxID=3064284 RepID=A0ABM9M8H9_9MYCO|nr:hypothetical protein [Mycolicibacterium sp. MU0050]CAJ1578973.1 hypothetical protein MU0050_000273 [Mycolicibacterium sp. MU0050]